MNITITGRGLTVQDGVKDYAEQKARKLERYFDQLKKIEIVMSTAGHNDMKAVEMIAFPRKGPRVVGQAEHEDVFAAVDLLIDKMQTQLSRLKGKRQDKRKRSGRVPPPPAPSDLVEDEQLETYDEVVDKFSERLE